MSGIEFSLSSVIPDLQVAVAQGQVVDLTIAGAQIPTDNDGVTSSLVVVLDPERPHIGIRALPAKRPYILIRDVLHLIRDYRGTIREAFDRLGVGGWLVVTVPHQFLAERKYRLPSRHGSGGLRLYTPATLIAEVEESLDATEYRLRLLRDDDSGYDYSADIHDIPEGSKRIVLAIQRIKRPPWAGQMFNGDVPEETFNPTGRILPKQEGKVATHILSPAPTKVMRILVVKLDHRGDYIMAVPALVELRARFPQAHITFVCGTWNADAAESSGMFDEVLPFNFFAEDASMKREPPRDVVSRQFAEMMKGRQFDLAVDMRFFDDTRDLLRRVDAPQKAGFDRWNNFPWLDIVLTLPSPSVDGRGEQFVFPTDTFSSAEHLRRHGEIVIPAASLRDVPRISVYGPYRMLLEGTYELQLDLRTLRGRQNIRIDIVHDAAQKCVFADRVSVDRNGCRVIHFELREPIKDFEVRITNPWWFMPSLMFRGARLVRKGAIVGVHQREAMYLLVQLVSMRLAIPYDHDVVEEA